MWVKALVAFLPAFYHFKSTWSTLIHAIDAYRCRWLFFWLFSFISNIRFTSEDIFKAFEASTPARIIIGITFTLAVDFYFIIIILNIVITSIISRFLNSFSSSSTGAAKISRDKFSIIILSAKVRIMSIYITAISVLVYDGRAPRIHICISTLFVKPIKLWAPPFSYIPCWNSCINRS